MSVTSSEKVNIFYIIETRAFKLLIVKMSFLQQTPEEPGLLLHLQQHLVEWTAQTKSTWHGCGRDWPPAVRCCRTQEHRKELRQRAWRWCEERRQAHVPQLWALQHTTGPGPEVRSRSGSVPQQRGILGQIVHISWPQVLPLQNEEFGLHCLYELGVLLLFFNNLGMDRFVKKDPISQLPHNTHTHQPHVAISPCSWALLCHWLLVWLGKST